MPPLRLFSTPIIYVWLGSSLPSWTSDFIRHCTSVNRAYEFLLLTDFEPEDKEIKKHLSIFMIESPWRYIAEGFMARSTESFWQNTSLRFPAIYQFCINSGINQFFHIELDNIIDSICTLEYKLSLYGCGIFAPRDNVDRAIGSFIFCNRLESMAELVELYSQDNVTNDMIALGLYAQKYTEHFWALPTESYIHNQTLFRVIDPEYCSGIFDAASIGQYMFGVDPIHKRYQPLRNCFVNEHCRLDWKAATFNTDSGSVYLGIKQEAFMEQLTWHRVYNLHVHSKSYEAVEDFYRKGRIFRRLLDRKSSIVRNSHYYYIGPFRFVYDRLMAFIKRLGKAYQLTTLAIRSAK